MKTPTVHEFLKSQGIDLDTSEDVAFTSTGKDGIKSPVSAIGTMEAYAKEYHASQSPAVTEVKELPTTTEVINYSKEYSCLNFKRGSHEQLNAMSDFHEGAEWFRGKVYPIISSLKSENERLKAEIIRKDEELKRHYEALDNANAVIGKLGLEIFMLKRFPHPAEDRAKETSSNGEGKE